MAKIIVTFSALLLVVLGVAIDFLPQELATTLGMMVQPASVALIQVLAAALLALGFINWFSKGNPMGGIYSRPLALGNMLFFGVAGISMVRGFSGGRLPLFVLGLGTLFALLAVCYAYLIFLGDPTAKKV